MAFQFAKEQIIERIRFDNPWWHEGQIDPFYNQMKRRLYFKRLYPLIKQRSPQRAVVLMGPRRVGKTVMLYHAIQELINSGVSPQRIIYLSIETPVYSGMDLENLLRIAWEATSESEPERQEWTIIFDEIQYLKGWEVHLKSLVDSFRQVKFAVSGSAAAALKLKSQESGAGRFTEFMLPPLTFIEYIELKENDRLVEPQFLQWGKHTIQTYGTQFARKLNQEFIHYVNYGGYPEVIFDPEIQKNPGRYIRSDIIDKVLLRDLPSLYGIQDVQELNKLFTMLAYRTGHEFSLEKISQTSGGVQKITIKKYIEYLEAAFLLKIVRRVDQNAKRFQRDNYFKIYLTNPSLRSALFSPLPETDDQMGNLVETAIVAQWLHREQYTPYYARWRNGEVDMVRISESSQKPLWAVEIKWSNRYFHSPKELDHLIKFCQKNGIKNTLATTIDKTGSKEIGGVTIHFLPAAAYAYTVGKNTFEQTDDFEQNSYSS